MTMNSLCLEELVTVPGVLGAFICQPAGNVIMSKMPQHFASGHVEGAAFELYKQQNAPPVTVGSLSRCEFSYHDFKFYVYVLEKGALFVLCRRKIEVALLDNKIGLWLGELNSLVTQDSGPKKQSKPLKTSGKTSAGVPPFLFVGVTLLVVIGLAGGAFFYFKNSSSPIVAVVEQAPVAADSEALSAEPAPAPAPQPVVTAPAKADSPVVSEAKAEVVLRIEGSSTLGDQLTPQIAMAFMKEEMFAGDVYIAKGEKEHHQRVVGSLGDGRHVAIDFVTSNSNSAFSCLEAGTCDIGMSSRGVTPAEMIQLEKIGPMNNSASEHILALDGIAVILHAVNKLDHLELQKIADIFTGKITSWSELPESGLSGPIQLYGRGETSGSSAVFRYLALHDAPFAEGMIRADSDEQLADQVADDKNGIGFVSLPYMNHAKPVAIEQDGADPVFPTPFTIATEDYPLSRRLFLYTAVNPKNYLARPFFQFALGEKGQDISRDRGFVSLTIDKIKSPVPASAPDNYRQSVAGADRLSLNFRFKSGSSELDNRGKRDLERLISFLIKPEHRAKSIRLLGFADSRGERAANCYLSKIRAEKVATILQWRGITTEAIEGFCDDMPIATNATALGRERNRRVEVWLGS